MHRLMLHYLNTPIDHASFKFFIEIKLITRNGHSNIFHTSVPLCFTELKLKVIKFYNVGRRGKLIFVYEFSGYSSSLSYELSS